MAKKKRANQVALLCPICTQLAEYKFDKYGRPYTVCSACGSRIFLKSILSQVGYMLMNEVIHASIEAIQPELRRRYEAEVLRQQQNTIENIGQSDGKKKQKAIKKHKAEAKARIESYKKISGSGKKRKKSPSQS